MKIIIADDEELVRVGLRDVLGKVAPDDEIFEAENGRKLIEMACEINPDICFVDIRMPGINGLEAIGTLSSDFPGICWIILSGYSDFDYARKALSLGVTDYLLKPATESEVAEALGRASEQRVEAARLKREKFEYHVSGVLNNSSAVEFDDFLMNMKSYAALVYMPVESEDSGAAGFQRKLFQKLRARLDNKPPAEYAGVFNIPYGYPAVIAGGNKPGILLQELQQDVSGIIDNSCRTIFSPAVESLQELLAYFNDSPDLKEEIPVSGNQEILDRSSRLVRKAEELVLELYNEPIGVAQIAEQLNITPNYLSSLFKKYRNISFTRYITELRLERAPEILEAPGVTVKEASQRLGYMSSRHFARLFKERYGMTPSDYINRL